MSGFFAIHETTLGRASSNDLQAERHVPFQRALDACAEIGDVLLTSTPDTAAERSRVRNAVSNLETTFRSKAGTALPGASPASTGIVRPGEWLALADEMTRIIAGTPTFFGRGTVQRMAGPAASIRDDYRGAMAGIAEAAHSKMVAQGLPRVDSTASQLNSVVSLPFILGRDPFTHPSQLDDVVRGLGPLVFTVGHLVCTGYDVTTFSPSGEHQHRVSVSSSGRTPVTIDLDHDGGFLTDSVGLVQSVVHSLLTVLQPNNLQIRVVDPIQLGRNVDYLHRLGDQAASIIGNKAATTNAEVSALLDELEGHITYVTQKYLQGEHASLTEYNQAAGEVAEPYRVIVVHDLLDAVSRSQNYVDDEAVRRLAKVAEAGRRCGVFLLVHQPEDLPQPVAGALSALPQLRAGAVDWAWLTNRLCGGEQWQQTHTASMARITPTFAFQPLEAPERPVSDAIINSAARGITTAAAVKVTPDDLDRSISRKAVKEAARSGTDWEFADYADPSTWWRRSSAVELRAPFGRAGAQDVAELVFACDTRSNALVAGVPGSGKSIWLHAVIMSLLLNYGPEELELYLVDFKEGVEFNQYAVQNTRQARVVAVESDRDFGMSVLENLDAEIERRGQVFKSLGGNDTNLTSYRASTGEAMPRVLLVMDEFQKLFERDDRVGARAGELLDRIIRQGRAFGVHVLMASQTLLGNDGLPRHTLDQVPMRVALRSSSDDSRRILADDNPDASLLNRPGEGILNTQGGRRDANQRFQTVFWESDARENVLMQMHKQLQSESRGADPWVFNGADRVPNEGVARLRQGPSSLRRLNLPLGMPFLIGQEATVRMSREPGANTLMVGEEIWQEIATLVTFAILDGLDVRLWLSGGEEDAFHDVLAVFERMNVPVVRRRMIMPALNGLVEQVQQRAASHDYTGKPLLVVVPAAHRLRDLDASDYSNEMAEPLGRVLSDGPDVGVHLVMGFDKWSSVSRRLTSVALRDFGVRVAGRMNRDDSVQMIDSDAATTLRTHQLIMDDPDHNVSMKVQRMVPLTARQVTSLLREADGR